MLATMIARLLDNAPFELQQNAYEMDPALAAVLGGTNPQHAIVSGLGAMASDSEGYPWNTKYIISSGNLLADFRANLNAESQGRLQVTRLYGMTDDPGVRDMLSFLIARDTYHQNMWYAAIKELEECEEDIVVPTTFPRSLEKAKSLIRSSTFQKEKQAEKAAGHPGQALTVEGIFTIRLNLMPGGKSPICRQHHLLTTIPFLENAMVNIKPRIRQTKSPSNSETRTSSSTSRFFCMLQDRGRR